MKQSWLRRAFALLLVLALILPHTAPVQGAAVAVYSVSGAAGTRERTVSELRRAWQAIRVPAGRFDETPSAVYPYRLGKLSPEFLRLNLDLLNFFRLAAGLPAVSDTDAANTDAQYGAVVLAAANLLSHDPPISSGMDGGFYQRGRNALGKANIAVMTFEGRSAAEAEQDKLRAAIPVIMRDYMNGRDSSGHAETPHRRWILHPALESVGFGCADAADGSMYQVLRIVTARTAEEDYDFIAWPASDSFPALAISPEAPWSVTLNPAKFRTPDRSALSITVTRQSDGRAWTINAASSANPADSSFLLVDTQPYGVDNCILFAFPSGEKDGYSGDYRVRVAGLQTMDGRQAMLDYQMRFVEMNCAHDWSPWTVDPAPSCTSSGLRHRVCRDCGLTEEECLPALGHDWKIDEVVEASTKYRSGTAEFTCSRCGWHKLDALPLPVCMDEDCPCRHFADAPARGNWAHNGIDFVLEKGIFNGTGKTAFSPKGKMTRAMLVTVLWRIAGKPEAKRELSFTDVNGSAYYAPAVRWASENGVVQGYSPQRFGPADNVTREQAVTLLQRFFAPEAAYSGGMDAFSDAQAVHDYARGSICWAIEHRVINGQADKSGALCLLPGDPISREQCASIIMRCMMNLNEAQPDPWSG